ncbi:MAG: substrate-binding domain-containing protein [Desulfovibrio sp.]
MLKKFTTLLLAVCLIGVYSIASAQSLMMATTTSTDNTGLLDYLAPKFQKDTGIELKWSAMGTGKALKFGQDCNADILFVHAPPAEKKFVNAGFGTDRTEVMYNDFVIVGPTADPAGAKGMSVTEALKTIADKDAVFVSRGDNSGTNMKEISLWKGSALPVPEKESWYVQSGQGMLTTINMAAEKNGYTMTDRATFIKYEANMKGKAPLQIIVEGDKVLMNQYSVIAINKAHCPNTKYDAAKAFINWVVSPKIQQTIADFRLLGKKLFIPNAK